jgi:hypothetical protein
MGHTVPWLRHYVTCQNVAGSIPNEAIAFFKGSDPSTCSMALGLTQPLTKMSTTNLPGGKGRPACKADNFTAICLENVGASMSLNPIGLYGLFQGQLYLFSTGDKFTFFAL